jgi:hypothetical protein
MFDYGWSKITGGQFSVHDSAILEKPLKEVDKFYIAWYLFSLSKSFNIIVGISQIVGAALIVINRTAIIGALLLLPILAQILLVDIAFTTNMFGVALPTRIGMMIISAIAILVYYRQRMVSAWTTLTNNVSTRFKYKWWIYLILPVIGFAMDFFFAILSWPIKQFLNWIIN